MKGVVIDVTGRGKSPSQKATPFEAKPPSYPADHQVGMKVPKDGSDCAKCEYLGKDGKTCLNKGFVMWNGSDALPAPADEYCCDFFEIA